MKSKNIVLCFDGTDNQIKAHGNTNVVKIFRALENQDGEQLMYYDPGVGTFSSPKAWSPMGRWASKMLGKAFGLGVKTNLAEAYTFLMNNWEPGDRIFIFGFSRGAFNARALAGLLDAIGIPRRSSENLVQYAIDLYARPDDDWKNKLADASEFRSTICRAAHLGTTGDPMYSVPVEYIGLWDTVNAPGVFRRELSFPKSNSLDSVLAGRHAVSIDEKRRPFKVSLVTNPHIEEAWFAGVHSDVGGGFEAKGLGDISLMWVLQGAVNAGIILRRTVSLRQLPEVEATFAVAEIHQNDKVWALAINTPRHPGPSAKVHASVGARRESDKYRDYGKNVVNTAYIADDWTDSAWARVDGPDSPNVQIADTGSNPR
ncbi:DUF2235 domain-containing protein [Aldersonia sp. NBC_00410]|uniref:DUF2235 domain-containing protein n=1 Tax=Aldersonia sp. NBC_00410 TaxID=2975954 RepID=UPI002254BDA3|nr:DUF2235 domain-containing protein [Aldersonia sp. NBC_00410]MCX5045509.1 DUF2235 domain-containing protein [Aldersonia sp. NBC_00410]